MPPTARIPLALWEREKEHIRALYLDRDKTLDELVKGMAEEHGFYATRAQYIRRLDSWKMRKYSTKEEWEYVSSLVRKRKNEGKESEIVMGGKPISVKKLKKELGRYPQPTRSEQPCPSPRVPPKDALDTIIARTPPATLSFDTKFITSATVPWFLFYDTFIPTVTSTFKHMGEGDAQQFALAKQTSSLAGDLFGTHFSLSTVAELITEKLPKRLSADDLQTKSLAPGNFIQILCWVVYQSSNSLLSDLQTDNFLQWIIDHGNMRILRQFTRVKCPATTVLKANLLLGAIRLGNTKTVQFLLNDGTNPEIIHRISRETALQLAIKARFDNAEIVELLLKHGASPNARCPGSADGRSPLYLAMNDLPRKTSIAKVLILAGADINVSYPKIIPPLVSAICCDDASLTSLLLKKGANPNAFLLWGVSPIHTAVARGCVESLTTLLQGGANANFPYEEGDQANSYHRLNNLHRDLPHRVLDLLLTPIDIAYKLKDGQMVDLLLKAGAHADGCAAFIDKLDQGIGTRALKEARIHENHRLVESLLRAGVLDKDTFVNKLPRNRLDPTLVAPRSAIVDGDSELVELLARKTNDINSDDARCGGLRFLAYAVRAEKIELVHLLLGLGADINPTSSVKGKLSILQASLIFLIKAIADVNQGIREISALTWSIARRNQGLFELLMSKGAKTDLPQDELPPLSAAIVYGPCSMTVRLIGAGADINRPAKVPFETNGKVLETPLQIAIRMRSIRLINILLDSHADVNYWEESMQFGSALNLAVFLRDRELVQLLLSRGADPNKTMSLVAAIPDIGQTADLKIFRLLLDHKADVNPQCLETPPLQPSAGLQEPTSTTAARWLRLTPLQAALERGHVDLAWMFLDAGADCRAPAFWGAGKTALQAAVMNGNMTFVEYFVRRGVNINACPATNNGATALQFAAIQGHYNVVVFLLENGADVNAPKATRGGRTALEGAAEHGRLDIVHLLLENDQEEESLGQRCEEAAVLAERNGHFVIAEILRGWKKP